MRWGLLALFSVIFLALPANSKKWSGIVAKEYDNAEEWVKLSSGLKEAKMFYGSVASSSRILSYFSDLKSKEAGKVMQTHRLRLLHQKQFPQQTFTRV